MSDVMTFPEKPEEFIRDYEFVDSLQVYTNGARLMTVLRVKQLLEHYFRAERTGRWINGVCSECGASRATDNREDFIGEDENYYCYICGAKMIDEKERNDE